MAQLGRDSGTGGLPPWIAAEHRNTKHPHVHVVMAANRRLDDGRYRTLIITRERLARMKISMARELYRQRGCERERDDRTHRRHRLPGALMKEIQRASRRAAHYYQRQAELEATRRLDSRERQASTGWEWE